MISATRCRAPDFRRFISRPSIPVIAALLLGTLICAHDARAAEGFFLGDSIGDDTARTIGIRGAARTSVHLRRAGVVPQFSQLPKGSIALMSLGLNDAADPYQSLTKDIERVIEAAEKTGEKFVWIGPPCVLKGWDKRNAELDAYLRERLTKTSIQYVSLRDPQICKRGMRSQDGEHFTPAGYRYVWEKIQRDSSFAAEVTIAASKPYVEAATVAKPRKKRVRVAAKSKPRQQRKKRRL